MAKKTRCFSYGGSATDIAGNLASPGLYDNDRGMSIGLSGAKHIASTDANNATPADPMQQYVGMKVTNSPSSQSRRDASPLARLDQEIAMGNAMGELSNTERYQLANPGNQPYTVGAPQGGRRGNPSVSVGVSPGSSAAASQEAQRIGIMQSLRNNLADQPLYAGYAGGGEVKETADQLIARMAEKYGTGGSTPTAAPVVAPTPRAQAQPQANAQTIAGAFGALKNRAAQIDAAVGYANGGKIKGPGTPTSDSIQAQVTDTGEPIAVSTGERIVSKAQDVYLQKVASGMGFDSLDAMLEAGTGKPVGPTIKGGMKHAFNGALLEKPRDPVVVPGKWINNGDFLDKAPMAGPVAGQIPPQAKIDAMQAQQVEAGKQNAVAPTPVKPTPPQGATPAELIAAQPTAAAPQESKPDQEIAKGGSITFGGKTVSLPEAAPVARDPNRQYDAHGNDMTRTNEMKAQLVGMQRERLMRDMGADITSQGTRVAAAQQLAQMDKDQSMQLLANRGAREDATAAMDQQLKGQQIATGVMSAADLKKTQSMFDAYEKEQDLDKKASLLDAYRVRTGKSDKYIAMPNRKIYDGNGQVIGEEAGGMGNTFDGTVKSGSAQTSSLPSFATKAELQAAIQGGKIKPGTKVMTPNGELTVK